MNQPESESPDQSDDSTEIPDSLADPKSVWQTISQLLTGQKSLELAQKRAEAFIADDETGLYRGEAMLRFGLCYTGAT